MRNSGSALLNGFLAFSKTFFILLVQKAPDDMRFKGLFINYENHLFIRPAKPDLTLEFQ
jgi:hypothetical protein